MARLSAFLFFVFVISGCATNKKTDFTLPLELKNKLFATQENFEIYRSINDPLFAPLKENKCLDEWEKTVEGLIKNLRLSKSNKERVLIWYNLANCYNYVSEYNKAIYYYDLVLTVEKKNKKMLSVATSNIGLIYEIKGLNVLSKSYYERSLAYDKNNHIASYLIAYDYIRQGELVKAEQILSTLMKKLPKSRVVRSTLGVSFVLSDNEYELKSKVLSFFNEKVEEKVLFQLSQKLYAGKHSKDDLDDLGELELKFPLLNNFRKFLLNKFGT